MTVDSRKQGNGISVDANGNAFVAGGTGSADFPTTPGAFQLTLLNPNGDAFVTKLNPGGNGPADLLYSSPFGGSGNGSSPDQAFGIAIDSQNNAYIAGQTVSTDFPVFSALATGGALNGPSDAFVAKLTLIPTLAVVPSSLDFGIQPLGVTSLPMTVTLTNNTSDPIPFGNSNLTITGSNAADFASPSNTCGSSISAGASCMVSVTFKPSAAAAESATLVITVMITDAGVTTSQSFNVSLSGSGSASAPGVGLAPTSLTFGGQLLTTTSAAQTVTLTNNGTSALTINSIAASGDFAETSTGAGACPISPATLAAAANCTISVTFAPTAVGARTGTLTITDSAGGSPHTVPLSGIGWDFTLTAPASVSVKAGKSVPFNVTMTPMGGFNQAVALACSEQSQLNKSTCTPSPTSVTAADGVTAQISVVTVTTKGGLMVPPTTPGPPISIRQIVPLALALLLLVMLFSVTRLRTRLGLVTAILIMLALAGCGYNGTKKGTSNLTITGMPGGVTKTITVSLTVT